MPNQSTQSTTSAASTTSITKILVANRGEIAVRVMKTAQNLGYSTVAVYSEADTGALHVQIADEAVCVGPSVVSESYLKIDNIIEAAKITGADAIHPGYGFLSENAAFANACQENGIIFIGPPVNAIELMGSKRQSKIAMEAAGVPCIPGYQSDDQSIENLVSQASEVGTPLMIKASAGGGGRGMRMVEDLNDIEAQLKSARSEAENAFGSGELILERAVLNPRHIEIQVFADQQGNVVHLGERDCSVQRRHQKVVEEAPSPAVDEPLRQKMGAAATLAAKACNYVGAGTVEFLLAPNGEVYFLEMNTRLQVEHPVTELVTGQDLVEWQIDIAQGAPLPLTQEQITLTGHAVEVRLYAEDTRSNYLPQTGTIHHCQFPQLEGLRIDHGISAQQAVSPFYDPMLAKVIAWGKNRRDALRKLKRGLVEMEVFGVVTNQYFLSQILQDEAFIAGDFNTSFLADHFSDNVSLTKQPLSAAAQAIAAMILHHQSGTCGNEHLNWSSSTAINRLAKFHDGEQQYEIRLSPDNSSQSALVQNTLAQNTITQSKRANSFLLTSPQSEITISNFSITHQQADFLLDGIKRRVGFYFSDDKLYFNWQGQTFQLTNQLHVAERSADAAGSGQIRAPMDGAVVDTICELKQSVAKGDTLAIIEAMKMEHPLKADKDGRISKIQVAVGDQVKTRQLLIEVTDKE
ncbi:MAG: acetyl-CoA carboxylase biotin carboxylase subunit [Pseudomonadales bacterium]|nr:acetyl-CoA carboxylase biotin carboxylase subunit [Pseudomonadales bacterium]